MTHNGNQQANLLTVMEIWPARNISTSRSTGFSKTCTNVNHHLSFQTITHSYPWSPHFSLISASHTTAFRDGIFYHIRPSINYCLIHLKPFYQIPRSDDNWFVLPLCVATYTSINQLRLFRHLLFAILFLQTTQPQTSTKHIFTELIDSLQNAFNTVI